MIRGAVVVIALNLLAPIAAAQQVRLSVTGGGSLMQNATLADYANGYITDATPVEYSVTLVTTTGSNSICATVRVQGGTAGDKANADVRWGLSAGSITNTLTSSAVDVASHHLTSSNPTASGVIYFRTLIDWGDAPQTYLGPNLSFSVYGKREGSASKCP